VLFEIDHGRVAYPAIHTLPSLELEDLLASEEAKVREQFAAAFREGEAAELRNAQLDIALASYRKAAGLPVRDRLQVGEAAEPVVTVRAMILSLARFGIAPAEQVKMLEKSWAADRELKRLDLCGKPAEPATAKAGPFAHANFR
jgi:hypothetical protein